MVGGGGGGGRGRGLVSDARLYTGSRSWVGDDVGDVGEMLEI